MLSNEYTPDGTTVELEDLLLTVGPSSSSFSPSSPTQYLRVLNPGNRPLTLSAHPSPGILASFENELTAVTLQPGLNHQSSLVIRPDVQVLAVLAQAGLQSPKTDLSLSSAEGDLNVKPQAPVIGTVWLRTNDVDTPEIAIKVRGSIRVERVPFPQFHAETISIPAEHPAETIIAALAVRNPGNSLLTGHCQVCPDWIEIVPRELEILPGQILPLTIRRRAVALPPIAGTQILSFTFEPPCPREDYTVRLDVVAPSPTQCLSESGFPARCEALPAEAPTLEYTPVPPSTTEESAITHQSNSKLPTSTDIAVALPPHEKITAPYGQLVAYVGAPCIFLSLGAWIYSVFFTPPASVTRSFRVKVPPADVIILPKGVELQDVDGGASGTTEYGFMLSRSGRELTLRNSYTREISAPRSRVRKLQGLATQHTPSKHLSSSRSITPSGTKR